MTDLDRRVAALMGWTWNAQRHHWADAQGRIMGWSNFSPSTNLLQAYQLWNEARPEGWVITVKQFANSGWSVESRHKLNGDREYEAAALADLPRAITAAWCEAKEGT